MERDKGITVKKAENMPEWYEQVCLKAELAEFGSVKGTMVIRPNGYAIWQSIQDYFNKNIAPLTMAKPVNPPKLSANPYKAHKTPVQNVSVSSAKSISLNQKVSVSGKLTAKGDDFQAMFEKNIRKSIRG